MRVCRGANVDGRGGLAEMAGAIFLASSERENEPREAKTVGGRGLPEETQRLNSPQNPFPPPFCSRENSQGLEVHSRSQIGEPEPFCGSVSANVDPSCESRDLVVSPLRFEEIGIQFEVPSHRGAQLPK
ncbi:hypothetical protein KM043_001846 [Ampulex compressa]|nr:hypothetical protein KM043_001846 [Ampulex compressa]